MQLNPTFDQTRNLTYKVTSNLTSDTRDQRHAQNVVPTCVRCSSLTISGGSSAARSGGRLIEGMSASLTGCHVGINSDMYPATDIHIFVKEDWPIYLQRSRLPT